GRCGVVEGRAALDLPRHQQRPTRPEAQQVEAVLLEQPEDVPLHGLGLAVALRPLPPLGAQGHPPARDGISVAVSPDARREGRVARAPRRGALLEDGGSGRLDGPPGPGASARPGTGRAAGAGEPRPILWGALNPSTV